MAVVTSDFLAGVLTTFRALFASEFNGALGLQGWSQIAMRSPVTGEIGTYEWFGTVPLMQDVTHGTLNLRGLDEYNFSITNKEWQNGIEVRRAALERDQLNLITPRIGQLAGEAARHPGQLIFDLLEDNPDAYDGTAFFANTRTIGESANVDNILAGTGTTVAQFQTDLAAARAQMRLFQDDRGRPMNLIGNMIMVPAGLEQTAWQSLNVAQAGNQDRQAIPATENGILNGSGYALIVNPYLTDANDWYLFHAGGPAMRPFVYQIEKEPELLSDTDPNSRAAITERTFVYSAYARYNVGVTDPRLGVKTTNV